MADNKVRIKHCLKRIAHLLGVLKEEMDDLCDALGIGKENDGK